MRPDGKRTAAGSETESGYKRRSLARPTSLSMPSRMAIAPSTLEDSVKPLSEVQVLVCRIVPGVKGSVASWMNCGPAAGFMRCSMSGGDAYCTVPAGAAVYCM